MSSATSSASSSMSSSRLIAILTGSTGSIGKAIALGLASHKNPQITLILPVRNREKGEKLRNDIIHQTSNNDIHIEHIELDSSDSIKKFAKRINDQWGHVNILINNAAVVPPHNRREETRDGLEKQFGVNAYSYYLLSKYLYPSLRQAASSSPGAARIVNVASNYAGSLNLDDINFHRRQYDANRAYTASKQADRLLSWKLARDYQKHGISVFACHPGVVTSDALKNLGMSRGSQSADDAAATPLYAALSKELEGTGLYLDRQRISKCEWQKEQGQQERLWQILEEIDAKSTNSSSSSL